MDRGGNQSTDTKFATLLVCDALSLLQSGRTESARLLIVRALSMLPKISDKTQDEAEKEYKASKIGGFYA